MNPSPASASLSMPISASEAEQYPHASRLATRIYEGVTIAAMLLLLGSLWVF